MAENTTQPESTRNAGSRSTDQPTAVDAMVVNGSDVWVLVARDDDDPFDLLFSENGGEPMCVCKAVLDGGVLVLGEVDSDYDPLLSEILKDEDRGPIQ